MADTDFDPFAQESTPAVSWTTPEDPDSIYPVGTKRYFEALGLAAWVQQRNFDTGKPDFWPAKPGEEPQPKMAAVIQVVEHEGVEKDSPVKVHQHKGTEEQALWAGKAAKGNLGALFNQLAKAQREAGGRIDARTLIQVELVDKKKDPSQPSRRAQNVFEAKIALNYYPERKAAENPSADPFGGESASSTTQADDAPPF
jgi:hypothetical protein